MKEFQVKVRAEEAIRGERERMDSREIPSQDVLGRGSKEGGTESDLEVSGLGNLLSVTSLTRKNNEREA